MDDQFFRYRMPSVVIRLEGRGNGCKTVLSNLEAIAIALDRKLLILSKYIGKILGSPVSTLKTKEVSVRGHHTVERIQTMIDDFVDECVLCPNCQNPETLVDSAKKNICLNCKACGSLSKLESGIAFDILRKIL